MVVASGSSEHGSVDLVPVCQLGHRFADFKLALSLGYIQTAVQNHRGGDIPVELLEVLEADIVQHLLLLGLG